MATAGVFIAVLAAGSALAFSGLPWWVNWLIGVGAVLTALRIIWVTTRRWAHKALYVIGLLEDISGSLPVLLEIATTFKPNGHTLPQRLDAIDQSGQRNEANHARIYDLLVKLWNYSHDSHHGVVNALAKVYVGNETIEALRAKLAAQPQHLDPEQ